MLLWETFPTTVMASDDTDQLNDTFDNFITDFSPILNLFCSWLAHQFLSQALGIADTIISAVAPLGILVRLASAIRTAGSPPWLTLIGSGQESRAAVEAEILSSTSDEVTEVWEGKAGEKIGKVVRLQQQRKIKAILYDPVHKNVYDFKSAFEEQLLWRVGAPYERGLEDLPLIFSLTLEVDYWAELKPPSGGPWQLLHRQLC